MGWGCKEKKNRVFYYFLRIIEVRILGFNFILIYVIVRNLVFIKNDGMGVLGRMDGLME